MTEVTISDKNLRRFGYAVFEAVGIPKKTYEIVVDSLVETSLRGVDSHGMRLIPHYIRAAIIGRINKNPKLSFKKTGSSTGILDADNGYGIAAGTEAMKIAIKLARRTGMGGVAVKNSSHFSAAAIYSLLAAKNNMIGLSFTHADSLALAYGAKKAYLGTNPICFAAPCENEDPFCLDMATTQISWNKLLTYKSQGRKLEKGWAVDIEGNSVEDPNLASALLPIASYKGYGLSLMVEIFSSLLTGMSFGSHIAPMYPLNSKKRSLGHFFMVIDISKFEKVEIFKKRLKELVKELRSLPVARGFDKVMVPGDPEKKLYSQRSKYGIPVSAQELEAFIKLLDELNIKNKDIRSFLFS